MRKRWVAWIYGILLVCVIAVTAWLAFSIGIRYVQTREWESARAEGSMSTRPPSLLQSNGDETSQVAVAIAEIEAGGGVPEGKRGEYEALLADIKTDEEPTFEQRVLALYLETETALQEAYEVPQSAKLSELESQLDLFGKKGVFQARFDAVKQDYAALESFLSKYASSLGTVVDGVLTVDINVDEAKTGQMLQEMEAQDLKKFANMSRLYEAMSGSEWSQILKRNERSRAWYAWDAARRQLRTVQKSKYVAVSEVKTYGDAKRLGLEISAAKKEGYVISEESPVTRVTYNGNTLSKGQYFKKGLKVTVEVEAVYERDPAYVTYDDWDEDEDWNDAKDEEKSSGAEGEKDATESKDVFEEASENEWTEEW